ncbi:hypothetical protein EEW87_002000 [Janibacter melonis]|uniref:Uncharacterized protein n=1 Tax=Janibacter melonis TaxID=262209 RepID=A0A5P8FJM1_9MICO|nr:hypothetical protein [Janibacter melonis]QFQ29361.1 hypothetical protein EEW87_002000 [Janibacter melonis]
MAGATRAGGGLTFVWVLSIVLVTVGTVVAVVHGVWLVAAGGAVILMFGWVSGSWVRAATVESRWVTVWPGRM